MPYFLAIDVGGTKTDYALADESRVLARARAGSIKRMRVDAQTAADHLQEALRELTAKSGLDLGDVERTCVGTAGNTVPLVTDWLRKEIPARVGGDLLVLGDVDIALDAAFPGEPGVIVIAGTGSNVAGRTLQGEVLTAGGWGPVLGDQGSGHRIGLEALRALCLALDSNSSSDLLRAVLDFWKLKSIPDLVAFANASPAPDFSQLVRVVVECAERGDQVAQTVLDRQGRELAQVVSLLLRRMQERIDGKPLAIGIAFAGGIMNQVQRVRHALLNDVYQHFPNVIAAEGVVDPLNGALWRARSGAGYP